MYETVKHLLQDVQPTIRVTAADEDYSPSVRSLRTKLK